MQDNSLIKSFTFNHLPVLAEEVLESINALPKELLDGGLLIDTTLGGGGHCDLILTRHPNLHAIGIDQDPVARSAAAEKLKQLRTRVEIKGSNFGDFSPTKKASFVLADLGVSSPQVDDAKRGFSFNKDGPLDMRMNPERGKTAGDLIAQLSEKELADVLYRYGEERLSRKIARRIKADLATKGPYKGTLALAYAIAGCYPNKLRYGRVHPATRSFQALRIAVNKELEALETLLKEAPNWLNPGGVLGVISFHSLEDRLVKRAFLEDERLERITRKPIIASPKELSINPRSRSAKYRIAKRIDQ